jgi:hypothetical protein
MAHFTLKKLSGGDHDGHHGVFDGGDQVGCITPDHLASHIKACGLSEDVPGSGTPTKDDTPTTKASELFSEFGVQMSAKGVTGIDELRALVVRGRAAEASEKEQSSRKLLLTEAVKDGKLDVLKAQDLARDNKITLSDYVAVQAAETALDKAIETGKILPRDRAFFFRDALERPQEFAAFIEKAVPVVKLGSNGIAADEGAPVDQVVDTEVRKIMASEKMSYGKALKRVFRLDPGLEQRYRAEHTKRVQPDEASERNVTQ